MHVILKEEVILWSITFVSYTNDINQRLILTEPELSKNDIKQLFLKKYPSIKDIKNVDEWDFVTIL